ncbi:hypothetical protein BT93_L1334 [Corymbia citriodora subsp. variegata]|uniref:Uncharacterized protein n=1 Tax=Corymbia citriodora subsp. variegata TaxID=360336 RepID=A0A8T0CSF2_CORYI|nr:hypothetical protein BT93_L1334 [Corymbia citriodora subsp. variegata]
MHVRRVPGHMHTNGYQVIKKHADPCQMKIKMQHKRTKTTSIHCFGYIIGKIFTIQVPNSALCTMYRLSSIPPNEEDSSLYTSQKFETNLTRAKNPVLKLANIVSSKSTKFRMTLPRFLLVTSRLLLLQ